jgi:two-component system, sensor histidine kinase and response regulator
MVPELAGAAPTRSGASSSESQDARADAVFHSHQQALYVRTDRMFAYLMCGQWLAAIIFALVVSPRTWAGADSQIHVHVWAALILGGLVSVFPAALALLKPGAAITRHTIAAAQMLMGALLIHLTGGRIETHFHVFGSLAMLAFYRDWRVLIPATTIVAVDHMLRGLYWPESVYGVAVASEWRWIEHAAWVVFEDVFLVISCVRGTQELRVIAVRTAVLEQANRDSARHTIEQAELISRLRLTQQQVEAATRAKSEFVANMSHELRTPLNAIILYSELLQEGAVDDKRSEDASDLGKIQVASKHLLGLINGILDLSKIEAGKMELHLESFDVRAMTDELISTMDAVVRGNNNRLSVSYDNDPQAMHADLTKTRQILFNLLSNAAKFTTNGSVTVHVGRRTVSGGECIEFIVSDDGIGLAEEQQQRLFRPFAQGDASISRKYGGTGLGLALVWRFCQLMGGEVTVQSTLGRGSTFTVRLPVTVVSRTDNPALASAEAAHDHDGARSRDHADDPLLIVAG